MGCELADLVNPEEAAYKPTEQEVEYLMEDFTDALNRKVYDSEYYGENTSIILDATGSFYYDNNGELVIPSAEGTFKANGYSCNLEEFM